jgi:hypothetical protein
VTVLFFAFPISCAAPARDLGVRLVWVRDDHAFVASRDSSALAEGDRVTFFDRGRPVADGLVTRVLEGGVSAARLTSGSLSRIAKFDRVRVVAETPLPRSIPRLRIGYPSHRRSNLLFACAGDSLALPSSEGYRRASEGKDETSLVRDPGPGTRTPWPDTLIVRFYDESADEEIALERGEIDVAVFWPGELSPHMRASRMWLEPLYGTRSHGVLVAIAQTRDNGAIGDARLAALNHELFRDDLWALDESPPPVPSVVNYRVDASLPGRGPLEQFLNHRQGSPSAGISSARVVLLDVSAAGSSFPRSNLEPALGPGEVAVAPWFAMRCPIVCAPELRATVRSLGTDRLADMHACVPMGHGR